MNSPMAPDSELTSLFSDLVENLRDLVPPYFKTIYCTFRRAGSGGALSFFIMNPNLPNIYLVDPGAELIATAEKIKTLFEFRDGSFPGMRVNLQLMPDESGWQTNFSLIGQGNDGPPAPQGQVRCLRIVIGHQAFLPRAPFDWRITEKGIEASHKVITRQINDSGERRKALIEPTGDKFKAALATGTKFAAEVFLAEAVPAAMPGAEGWTLSTPHFWCAWPERFSLHYAAHTVFVLVGQGGDSVFVQGPLDSPQFQLESLLESNQAIVDRGVTHSHNWIEVDYELQGKSMRQRHYACRIHQRRLMIVTAQSVKEMATATWYATDEMVRTIRLPGTQQK